MNGLPLQIDFPDGILSGVQDAAAITRLADFLLQTGIERGASAILLHPTRKERHCTLWIDSRMWSLMTIPALVYEPLLVHYRTLAGIPTDQNRVPHMGSFRVTHNTREFNVRVVAVPTLYGMKVVLSVCAPDIAHNRAAMGLGQKEGEEFDRLAALPQGLLLIAGPNGMGRTTTAAALLNRIDDRVATLEAVEEYTFEGAIQTYYTQRRYHATPEMVRPLIDRGSRVIFLDSLNHPEAAEVALDAVPSGVLAIASMTTFDSSESTVLDALDTINRLFRFGIAPARIAQALSGICAQRLVRRICPACAVDDVRPASDLQAFGYPAADPTQPVTLRRGVGCIECQGSGVRGRIGVFEVLTFDDTLATMLANGATEAELREVSYATGRSGMREDALHKILAGVITIEAAELVLRRVPCIPPA